MQEKEGLKINSGAAVADATLVPSARRPRKTIKKITTDEHVDAPSTIDDPAILDEIKARIERRRIGRFA